MFLNSMKLWAMKRAGLIADYGFDLNLHAEVLEACAYHYWGLFDTDKQALGTVVLGGGVPKNYNLQPEPALGQVLGLPDVRGYLFDIQIVSAPVTDGSLSGCAPAEAVTWGKVNKDHYTLTTDSMQADYSMLMPFVVRALLENRQRYATWAERMGEEALLRSTPRRAATCAPRAATTCSRSATRSSSGSSARCARTRRGCSTRSATRWRGESPESSRARRAQSGSHQNSSPAALSSALESLLRSDHPSQELTGPFRSALDGDAAARPSSVSAATASATAIGSLDTRTRQGLPLYA